MKKKDLAENQSWQMKSKIQGDFRFDIVNMVLLGILALIFDLLLSESHTRLQFLSMVALTATIAASSAIARRMREA